MTYRAILVHVPLALPRVQIELAIMLAKRFEAHLTGLGTLSEVSRLRNIRQNPFLRIEPGKVEDLIQAEYEQAAQAEEEFRTMAARAGVSHSWFTGEGEAAAVLVHACRLQDLAVVEQGEHPSELLWGPTVQLALSGHSALIVPSAWKSRDFGRRALVAWSGTAQAAAALRRALPLLRRAEHVTILNGPSREAVLYAMRMPPLDPAAYLHWHGVATDVQQFEPADADAGRAILEFAGKDKADLIVMGAFGRSRFREWILGGATRHVLENMTVPTFMAHQ